MTSLEPSSATLSRSSAASSTQEERLTALLSSSQFSVASYLNSALGSQTLSQPQPQLDDNDSNNDMQRRMAELALQLQLQTQSCHEDIGRIGAELQAILPRCAADVGRIGVGLDGMKIDATSLLEATQSTTSHEVANSLETLSTLHALRSNLSRTKEILTAAATWDTTLSSIAPLLAQQNLTEAVHALAKLESGARALRGMPSGKEERQRTLAKIRQQIQALLQPQLKHALQNMTTRIAPLQQCVALYTSLGTMETLQQEYVKNRPGMIHKAWFSHVPVPEEPSSFVSFLPNWYDAVLSLLAEERRQSVAVFGPNLAPEIITKVLGECFRPILTSFQSRLESLFSSNGNGSLESICAAYEATLQFLSMAYESVAGGWLDVAEATSIDSKALYEDVTAVFMTIASPFVTYQERLSTLEESHSGIAKLLVAKEFQQTASSVNATGSLVTLQDATERLWGLAPFIFPIAESAVARFELLNGGFRAMQALSTVDRLLLAGHADELAIVVRTLSAAMTANENQLAENFDEQHVLCALEVLKMAGSFRRDLLAFEVKTRERLGVLSERMSAHAAQKKLLQGNSGSSFPMPDSMSAVEIDSMLISAVCSEPDDDESHESFSVLQRLASSGNPVALYPEADEATARLARSCHTFVFDVCSSVPRKHLADMPSMSTWREKAGPGSFDSYGTLPQPYITSVGEHMLALVQALEPFVSDPEALALANEVMDNVRSVALQPWREFMAAAGAKESDSVIQALIDGKALAEFVLDGFNVEEEDDDDEKEEDDDANREGTIFCNAWLDVVGLAVTGHLLERIMRIQQLSPKGCEHLSADLTYLINVLSALGVSGHPHPLVHHVAELAMMDGLTLQQQIQARDRNVPLSAALRAAETRIASMRGIATSG